MNVTVENGLGFGCDKEAIRLIKNINYGSVKNRGVRLKTKKKFRVEFKLPQEGNIKYNLTKNSESNKDNSKEPGKVKKYLYSIKINR